jgi:D-glycero-D-manno-heptose 1,7-bisphosphate phosphatase
VNKAIFLDRDGVLILEKHYLKDVNEVELIPGVGPALKRAQDAGYFLFIVSNQSGIGRGLITPEEAKLCFDRTLELLAKDGVTIKHVYCAPEHPDAPSIGRKPSPFFVGKACFDYDINPAHSFFIGDRLSDLQCAIYSGTWPYLVLTGYGEKNQLECQAKIPALVTCKSLVEAVKDILDIVGIN